MRTLTGEAQISPLRGTPRSPEAVRASDQARSQAETAFKAQTGIPQNFVSSPSTGPGGVRFTNPQNRHEYVRVMPGNPNSPNPAQQQPYVVQTTPNGHSAVSSNGAIVPRNSEAAHVPRADFRYVTSKD